MNRPPRPKLFRDPGVAALPELEGRPRAAAPRWRLGGSVRAAGRGAVCGHADVSVGRCASLWVAKRMFSGEMAKDISR
jgi:hypothetical protein